MKIQKKVIVSIVSVLFFFFMEILFFRNIIFDGAYFGDFGDGKLTMLLAEHWWNVFCGTEGVFELPIFYPVEGVIGYTDMMLGFGLLHSLFRLLGLNMYRAYVMTLLTVHFLGTLLYFYILHVKLNIRMLWSYVGVCVFSYANAYAGLLGHTQLMALSVMPLMLLFFLNFVDNYKKNKKIYHLWAVLLITSFVLMMYTAWYIAFFTALYMVLFVLAYGVVELWNKNLQLKLFFVQLKSHMLEIIGWIIYAVVLMIPFVKVYLPALKNTGGYDWSETVSFLPEVADLINVGTSNYLEVDLMRALNLDARGYVGELNIGYPLVVWGLLIVLFISSKYLGRDKEERSLALCAQSIFISSVIGLLLILRLSANGISGWWLVAHVIPGGKSIRTVCRFALYLIFPLSLFVALAGNQLHNKLTAGKRKRTRILAEIGVICILALVIVSNIRQGGVYSISKIADGEQRIEQVSAPPDDCKVFFIEDSSDDVEPTIFQCCLMQMNAYEIANNYHIKTINGYSGQFPEGWGHWDGIYCLYSEEYEQCIREWMLRYQLTNVYCYDMGTDTWRLFE